MEKILLVGIGGAAGAVLRFGMSGAVQKWASSDFPLGTVVVNVAGCFLIGMLWAWHERSVFSPTTAALVFAGFLGSFTTFSTFGLETLHLLREGQVGFAMLNVVVSNVFGIAAAFLGFMLVRFLLTGGFSGLASQ